ncbi:Spy/CpxP family protein refolding chaperone [Rhodovulum sp. DZ06]|uniref:Spy/CpxP family protein refolding chaperone n=1 Tax=Rhodovulum sp. DZ06 TaxID=3425126 RepID=UPI003D34EDE2
MTIMTKAAVTAAALALGLSTAHAAGTYTLDNEARILSGEAFGDAALAESAGYPDPELVIQWAARLGLSDGQVAAATRIRDAMIADAKEIAPDYVRLEHELHALFEGGRAGSAKVRALTADIAELEGRLRFIHLDARLRMRFELTRDQLRAYNRIKAGES